MCDATTILPRPLRTSTLSVYTKSASPLPLRSESRTEELEQAPHLVQGRSKVEPDVMRAIDTSSKGFARSTRFLHFFAPKSDREEFSAPALLRQS
jgi:hypothetical protein